jgi:hypothetical protein
MEAAADEVVHPARAHPVERAEREVEDSSPQEELDRRGRRELRRVPEPSPLGVVLGAEVARCLLEQRVGERLARGSELRAPAERVDERGSLLRDVVAL